MQMRRYGVWNEASLYSSTRDATQFRCITLSMRTRTQLTCFRRSPSRLFVNRNEAKRLPCATLDFFIAKIPLNSTEEFVDGECVRRESAEFETRNVQLYEGEDALLKEITQQRQDSPQMDMIEFAISMVSFTKKRDFEAADKRGQKLKFVQEFFNKLLVLAPNVFIGDSFPYYLPTVTNSVKFVIDGLYRSQPLPDNPVAIAAIPVFESSGFDYEKIKVFWNANQQSSLMLLQYEDDDCQVEYTEEDDLESLNQVCFILFEYKVNEEEPDRPSQAGATDGQSSKKTDDGPLIEVRPFGFTVAPVKTVNNYVAGSFQFPIIYCDVEKADMKMIQEYYFWEIQTAIAEKVKSGAIQTTEASMLLRILPKQLAGVFTESCDAFLMNSMFLVNQDSRKAIFTERHREAADNFDKKVSDITPSGIVGLQVIEAIEQYIEEELKVEPLVQKDDSKSQKSPTSNQSKKG